MCVQRPLFLFIPITTLLSTGLAVIYTVFYFALGPLSLDQECGYGLFITSKWLMFAGSIGAIYVVLRNRSELSIGGVVVILLTLASALGVIASHKLREPTKKEMQIYLEEHFNNSATRADAVPAYLLKIQRVNQCCGILGYEDYNSLERDGRKVSVPESCCRVPSKNCGQNLGLGSPKSVRNRIYVNGCFPSGLKDMGQPCYGIYKTVSSIPICTVLWDIVILLIFIHYFRSIRLLGFPGAIVRPMMAPTPLPADCGDVDVNMNPKASALPEGSNKF